MKFKGKIIIVLITILVFIVLTNITLNDSENIYEALNSVHLQRKLLLPRYREDLAYICSNFSNKMVMNQTASTYSAREETHTAAEVQDNLNDSAVEKLLTLLAQTDEIIFDFEALSEGSYQSLLDNEKTYLKKGEGLIGVHGKYK